MYLHISFKSDLAGLWKPKLPDGMELKESKDAKYPEPNIPRISLAPSVEKCFSSIYPNVSSFFEEKKYPYMDFFVYTPKEALITKICHIPSDVLTEKRQVWDAHFTKEIWVTKPLDMFLLKKVRIYNPGENAEFYSVHPFNIKSNPPLELSPKDIRVKTLTVYPNPWTLRSSRLEW